MLEAKNRTLHRNPVTQGIRLFSSVFFLFSFQQKPLRNVFLLVFGWKMLEMKKGADVAPL
jgi:hypothetical protein